MSNYLDHEVLGIGLEQQILELNKQIAKLRSHVSELEKQLAAKEQLPVPTTVVKQIIDMEAVIRRQQDDLNYYKSLLPVQFIINRESKQKTEPTRKGGVPK